MTEGPTARDLSLRLADDIENVVAALKIDVVRREGRRLVCFSPWNAHKKPKLEIETAPLKGKWNDWSESQFGDALSLVGCTVTATCDPKGKKTLAEAIRWAKRYFGIDVEGFDQAAWDKARDAAEERARKAKAKAARELSQHRVTAKGLWLAAGLLQEGDAAWSYFAARQIDLAALATALPGRPRLPRGIRLSPSTDWKDLETGEIAHTGPCLASAMTLANGEFGSLHRTWIDPARPGKKADVAQPRKMWPASEGCAIRLWRGESGLSDRQATEKGLIEDLVLCEGVETGLSIALMAPELRVYAVGSLPGLGSFVPPKFVRKLIVAAENDWNNPQAKDQLTRACVRFTEECGKSVSLIRSPEGNDFNDLLTGG